MALRDGVCGRGIPSSAWQGSAALRKFENFNRKLAITGLLREASS